MRKATYFLLVVVLLAAFAVPALSSGDAVNGGGQLREELGSKRAEWLVVSFGVWAEEADDGGYVGELEVNFHNVGRDELDGSKFHGTEVTEMNFSDGNDPSCHSAMNMTVYGEWNHEPGYHAILRAGDAGSPGSNDTVRVELFDGGTKVYDTNWFGEFKPISHCVGTARTGLDAGNITIVRP